MALQPGDCVKTETGEVGKVVHISRLTVFVAIAAAGEAEHVAAYLESQLTKLEPSGEQPECGPDEGELGHPA
jgi:hypothetical protein